jgi:hypothetical protein
VNALFVLKIRSTLKHGIKPIIRSLKHKRSGDNSLSCRETYTYTGYCQLVYKTLFPIYRSKGCAAVNLANTVWTYWANFGHTDCIISDKGPELTSNLMKIIFVKFSMTDKHANGVERTIKEVQRHLRAIVYDTRIQDIFAHKTMMPAVQFILSNEVNSETCFRPFELSFGSSDANYTKIPEGGFQEQANEYLTRLNYNLILVREISTEYQQKLVKNKLVPRLQRNRIYDLVLFDKGVKDHPNLSPRYSGPYEVITQKLKSM